MDTGFSTVDLLVFTILVLITFLAGVNWVPNLLKSKTELHPVIVSANDNNTIDAILFFA